MIDTTRTIGTCLNCEYDLRALGTHVCPECGTAFDPANPATLGPSGGTPLKPIYRWATARAGWPMWTVTAAMILGILWFARFPEEVRLDSKAYRFLFPLLFWLWGCRLMLQLFLKTCSRDRKYRRRIRLTAATLVVSAVVGAALLVHGEVISSAAMKFSRS